MDPDVYSVQVDQLVDQLPPMGENISGARTADKILWVLTPDCNLVRFQSKKDPNYELEDSRYTLRNMYTINNRLSKSVGKASHRGTALGASFLKI